MEESIYKLRSNQIGKPVTITGKVKRVLPPTLKIQAGAFQGGEAQETEAEKVHEKAIFLICTTPMYD